MNSGLMGNEKGRKKKSLQNINVWAGGGCNFVINTFMRSLCIYVWTPS